MELDHWKDLSEIAKNCVEVLGLLGGLFFLYQWIYARRDRATEVLLQLDRLFTAPDMVQARQLVEDDQQYTVIRSKLLKAATPDDAYGASYQATTISPTGNNADPLEGIDKLLRFYVLLCGVREAKQVPDSALRKCFRYWLAHYYNPSRRELRLYIETFYPTLAEWLEADRHWLRRFFRRTFFTPERFGWNSRRQPSEQEIRRALKGRVLVITGAGISADSGIPTYRGDEGDWRSLNPRTLATRSAFEKNAKLVWEWYCERRSRVRTPHQTRLTSH